MVSQFQPWLHELVSLAESNHGRLHLNLHVTQNDVSEICIEHTEPKHVFQLTPSTATPRPYAHLSTLRKLLVLICAFLGSGALLVYVRYGQKLIKMNASYWPLQRFVEFLVVIVGSCLAYGVASFGRHQLLSNVTELRVDNGDNVPLLSRERFLDHFDIKFERAKWDDVFQSIVTASGGGTVPRSIGVYVSGPKALYKAIDGVTVHNDRFDVHVEEFEM
ncbi:Aste57867_2454 [Aphanomyces stellatus]|nr:hypothetical protein As57867_002448 [Aphanomyces stellatus]VFT79654.1 Aste57867_2454 [Aphanomyces stellatus]